MTQICNVQCRAKRYCHVRKSILGARACGNRVHLCTPDMRRVEVSLLPDTLENFKEGRGGDTGEEDEEGKGGRR